MATWMSGTVKDVPSGDTLVIAGSVKSGIAPELRLTLSSLQAPRLGRRDGASPDEPWASQSREFLRELSIGRKVTFRQEYSVESAGGARPFGSVFLSATENVAALVAQAGWARVKGDRFLEEGGEGEAASRGGAAPKMVRQSPYHADLARASAAAEARELGVFSAAQPPSRPLASADEFDSAGLLAERKAAAAAAPAGEQPRPLRAIVERVATGSLLRVTLLPCRRQANVWVAGVAAPGMGGKGAKKPEAKGEEAAEAAEAEEGGEGAGSDGPAAAAPTSAALIAAAQRARGAAAPQPEPFALEARAFVEARALCREVELEPFGVSQFGALVAAVKVPEPGRPYERVAVAEPAGDGAAKKKKKKKGKGEGGAEGAGDGAAEARAPAHGAPTAFEFSPPPASADLSSLLLERGLARAAEWALQAVPAQRAFRLREAERAARRGRAGLWASAAPAAGAVPANAALSSRFEGTVVEAASGDAVVVRRDAAEGEAAGPRLERRVNLSSVRAPRAPQRHGGGEPWGSEAKEFLRRAAVGRRVAVSMEYEREVGGAAQAAAARARGAADDEVARAQAARAMEFGSVRVLGGEAPFDLATAAVRKGLAKVIRHRAEEERAEAYEELVEAEEAAKAAKAGVWSPKEPAPARVNDLTGAHAAARAKSHLPFLQRAGWVPGVVEYVASGHRFRIHVPKEGVTLSFALDAVRCPRASPAGGPAPPPPAAPAAGSAKGAPSPSEPFGDEAAFFSRSRVLQRDVLVNACDVDRSGTFLGQLRLPAKGGRGGAAGAGHPPAGHDLAVELAAAGLGKATREAGDDVWGAQEQAKAHKRGVWSLERPEAEAAEVAEGDGEAGAAPAAATAAAAAAAGGPLLRVVVTDVKDGNRISFQAAEEPRVRWVAEQVSQLVRGGAAPLASRPRPGDLVVAPYEGDGAHYRARVTALVPGGDPADPRVDVTYIDYGNGARLAVRDLLPIPPPLAAVPPLARDATLAFVRAPALDAELGDDAAAFVAGVLGGGRPARARVEADVAAAPAAAPAAPRGWGSRTATSSSKAAPARALTLSIWAEDPEDLPLEEAPEADDSLNARLAAQGLAKLAAPPARRGGRGSRPAGPATAAADEPEVLAAVRQAVDEARSRHLGIFRYGDVDSDEEEAAPAWGARR